MTQADQTNYEIRVGIFTIIALILLLFGWGWLKGVSLFHTPQRFTVRFHDVAGLSKSATVNINGVRVGVIESIELKARGQVLVHPRITAENVVVPRGSTVTIQTLGLVGAKYLEVTLPEQKPGIPTPPPLEPDDVVIGQDPVRIELVMNDVGAIVRQFVSGMKGKKLSANIAQTMQCLNNISSKLDKSMEHFSGAADNVSMASQKFGTLADSVNATTSDMDSFFVAGKQTMQNVNGLTGEIKGTNKKLNGLLSRPEFSSDLKEVAQKAHETSLQIAAAVHELNGMLSNDNTRHDLITALDKLDQSTNSIASAVSTINGLARDKDLQNEFKDLLAQTRNTLDRVNSVLKQPSFNADLHDTLIKVKSAATNLDIAAQQIQRLLGKKHPMLHLMFGSGKLPKAKEDF